MNTEKLSSENDTSNGILGAVSPSLTDWQDLKTHPKNTKWVEGLQKNNEIVKCHYACDLSGEEQPAFEGFFKDCGSYFAEVDIIKWRPINEG
jgi:hypothetical protein